MLQFVMAVTNGLTGLGVMGYPMALNLRSKMDPKATLLINDVSESALAKFQEEMKSKGPIEVVKNGAEAAERAVRFLSLCPFPSLLA